MRALLLGVGLAPGYRITNGGSLVPRTLVDPLAAGKEGSQEMRVMEEGRERRVAVGSWLLEQTDLESGGVKSQPGSPSE